MDNDIPKYWSLNYWPIVYFDMDSTTLDNWAELIFDRRCTRWPYPILDARWSNPHRSDFASKCQIQSRLHQWVWVHKMVITKWENCPSPAMKKYFDKYCPTEYDDMIGVILM